MMREMDNEEDDMLSDQEGLLDKRKKKKSGSSMAMWCHRFTKTICLSLAFFTLGLCIAIPGPTLMDLQERINSDTTHTALIFTARSIGYLLGSLVGGFLFDYFDKQLMLTMTLFVAALATSIIPWSLTLTVLAVMFGLQGISMGVLDTGGNVFCVRIWGKKSPPYMQAMHFAFGIGAFVAPLLSQPFLSNMPILSRSSEVPAYFSNPLENILNTTHYTRHVRDVGNEDLDGVRLMNGTAGLLLNISSNTNKNESIGTLSSSVLPPTTSLPAIKEVHVKKPTHSDSTDFNKKTADGSNIKPHLDRSKDKIKLGTDTGSENAPNSPESEKTPENREQPHVTLNSEGAAGDRNLTDSVLNVTASTEQVSSNASVSIVTNHMTSPSVDSQISSLGIGSTTGATTTITVVKTTSEASTTATTLPTTTTASTTTTVKTTTTTPSTTTTKTTTTSTTTLPTTTTTSTTTLPTTTKRISTTTTKATTVVKSTKKPSVNTPASLTSKPDAAGNIDTKKTKATTMSSTDIDTENSTQVSTTIANVKKPIHTIAGILSNAVDAVKNMSRIQIAYSIIAGALLLNSVLFMALYCYDRHRSDYSTLVQGKYEQDPQEILCCRILILVLMFFFFFSYVGMETTFGGLLMTFTVNNLGWTKDQGAIVTAIFWGSLAVGRGFSIFIANCCKPPCMLVIDLVLLIIGAVVLSFGMKFDFIVWMGTLAVGFGMSSIFPTAITWMEQYYRMTGKSTAVLVMGSALGQMIVPVVTVYFYQNVESMSLMYSLLVLSVFMTFLYLLMQLVVSRAGKGGTLSQNGFMHLRDDDNVELDEVNYGTTTQESTRRRFMPTFTDEAEYNRLLQDEEDDTDLLG